MSLIKQIEKIQNDRLYLRTVIETMLSIEASVPGQIKPAVLAELKKALDKTADLEEG
jgi:hypothetical protein